MKKINLIIKEGEILIKENNVYELEIIYKQILEEENNFDLGYLFQKLFLKACIYGNKETILWFINIYNNMDFISKSAYKHTLNYAKYLIKKRRDNELYKWYIKICS
tara:strand:+ start:255 stop:572 length:318 start_codon:yes stop_codon:yes gene_type:complete